MRDTGVGIPAHELPHIFERFHRVKGSVARTYEGAGIGLALVENLVTLHGGTICADSIEGRETIVTVSIPLGSAHLPHARLGVASTLQSAAVNARAYVDEASRWLTEDTIEELGDGPSTVGSAPGGPRPRIVCADDNADMRAYLHRLLQTRYDVEIVADGEAALRAVRRRIPDLVVSDVMMPGRDGLELLRQLREDHKTHLVPVVLLSARAGEESQVDGLRSGADDYLVKPFSSRELLARIAAHLEIARVRKSVLRKEQAALVAIQASEAQRRRISRELHDGLGQQLTALVLGLRTLRTAVGKHASVGTHLEQLQAMATQLSRDLHHVALEMRPGALDEKGLHTAVSNYVEEWSRRNNVRADFQYAGSGPERFPAHVETTVYRIVQEALTNVSRHAKATAVNVVLQRHGDDVIAIVEDDGCGFDATHPNESSDVESRLGLLGMRERAALVGGLCHVESDSGGTTVYARIPVSLDERRHG